jgi:hypothetical protein
MKAGAEQGIYPMRRGESSVGRWQEYNAEDAVRDASLSIPARWAYIIPIGMHAVLGSCRGHYPGAEETTTPLKGGVYGHERTHDRHPR